MYPEAVVAAALTRLRETNRVSVVAGETGISPRSLRRWLAGATPGRASADRRTRSPLPKVESLAPLEYAYLLGVYLGDGWVSRMPRTWRLRIVLDQRYPAVIEETARSMRAIAGGSVGRLQRIGCIELSSYWLHWPYVLPQHGPGRKHDRLLELAPWQVRLTTAYPEQLVRGLIHSDGTRYVARQRVGDRTYSYARYEFANRSEDIKRIFCAHLDLLGIGWTRPNQKSIAIARRREVAKLDAFVGPKR